MSVKTGSGGRYSKKYVKATAEEMRTVIIPTAADYCARQRVLKNLTPQGYRTCLKNSIARLLRGESLE